MDHKEEQQMELEALEAILEGDLQAFDGTRPDGWATDAEIHRVLLRPSEDAATSADDVPLQAELLFAHTPRYPEEAPLAKARSVQGLSDADAAALQDVVDAQIQENLGMSMIYALVDAAQEWLTEKASQGLVPEVDPLVAKREAEEAEERRLAAIRAHGTPVTPHTFAPWKQRFYAELKAARARQQQQVDDASKGRISGKQYFLQADSRTAQGAEDGMSSGSGTSSADVSDDDIDYSDDDDDGMLEMEAERLVSLTA